MSAKQWTAGVTALTFAGVVALGSGALAAPKDEGKWWKPRVEVYKSISVAKTPKVFQGQWKEVYEHPPVDCATLGPDPSVCDYEEDEGFKVAPPLPFKKSPRGLMKLGPELSVEKAVRARNVARQSGGDVGVSGGPVDTSVAAAGNRVVYTDNTASGTIRGSVDGGATWAWSRQGTTVFPDNPDGGFCCDQIVEYIPSIRSFVWVYMTRDDVNNKSRFRIATVPAAAMTRGGFTGLWRYFDLTTDSMNWPDGQVDRPEVSFGDDFLYLGFHIGSTAIMSRVALDFMATGEGDHRLAWWQSSPTNYSRPNTPVQNAGDAVYWMGVKDTATLWVYRWAEDSDTVTVGELTVPQFPADWSAQPIHAGGKYQAFRYSWPEYVEGAARSGDMLYFAWGGPDGGTTWPQATNAMVIHVGISGANTGSLAVEWLNPWWSQKYAFGRPELNTYRGNLGAVMGVQDMATDTIDALMLNETERTNYLFAQSGTPEPRARWGDYMSISPWYGKLKVGVPFIASGYRTDLDGSGNPVQVANWGVLATR
jgi:hypothetical protein